jgi:hypothetical protein
MYVLHQTGFLFHIFGILLLAGGSIGGIIVERFFWQQAHKAPEKCEVLLPLLKRLPVLTLAGSLVILLSGLLMLKSLDWMIWGQLWFYTKITLYTLLVLNTTLVARPAIGKIGQQITSGHPDKAVLLALQRKMLRFHFIEFFMLILLLWVTMFRF